MFEVNAKALVTLWSSDAKSDYDLSDYAHREWAGLIKNYYKGRF